MAEDVIDMSTLPTKTVAEVIEVLQACPLHMHVGVGSAVGMGENMAVNIYPVVGFTRLTPDDNTGDPGVIGLFSYDGEMQS